MQFRFGQLVAGLVLLCAIAAHGQGACYPAGIALLDTGRPAGGASIRVCSSGSTGTPCTPLASIFTDPTLTVSAANPITADARGNFGFCAGSGRNYDIQLSGSGITTLTIKNLPLPIGTGGINTLTFSATPTFDASLASVFKLTLTANVTSSTLSNAVAGQALGFLICQDATGGRTFVPPANVLSWVTIPTAANACTLQTFIYDGTNAQPDGDTAGQVLAQDGAVGTPSISFENESNSGWYRGAAGDIRFSRSGADLLRFLSAQIIAASTASYAFGSSGISTPDTGISRCAATRVCVGTNSAGNHTGTYEGQGFQIDGATSGSVTLDAPATAGSNTNHTQAVTDTFVYRATTDTLTNKTFASPTFTGTASGNATIPTAMLTAQPGFLQFGCTGVATSSVSNLVLTFGTCAANTGFILPIGAGTVRNLFCRSIIAGSTAGSGVMTVRKNIVATALTCTIGTGTTCSDTTHSFSVAAGDSVDIQYATGAAETLNSVACTVEKGS